MWQCLWQQGSKLTYHLNRQTYIGVGNSREHQRQLAMNTMNIENGSGVVYHLTLKIVYLHTYYTQRWRNLIAAVSLAIVCILYAGLNHVAFLFRYVGLYHIHKLALTVGHSLSVFILHPLHVVVGTLAHGVHHSHKFVAHLTAVAGVHVQCVESAVQVGRQLNNTCTHTVFNAYYSACRQSVRITQLSVCYLRIVNGYAHFHLLSGQIPLTVGLNVCSHGAQAKHHCSYQ